MPIQRTPRRRGANALEFALIAPLLVVLLGGLIDYGWFFWREALAVNAVREGVRSGSLKAPDPKTETAGQCAACLTQANSAVTSALNAQGFSGFTIASTLERMPATGTPCSYAIVVAPTIPHTRVFPIVPGNSSFKLRVVSMAQSVPCP